MTLLASLLTPSFGLLAWMLIGFGLLVFILVKFAWPVITKSIAQREEYIETQLAEAEKIKSELANLSKKHDEMMAQTKAERDKILGDARKISEKMYANQGMLPNTCWKTLGKVMNTSEGPASGCNPWME